MTASPSWARWPGGSAGRVLVLLFGLLVWLPGLTSLPAIDRDEARFAQATVQMLETGNFVDIRFQAEPRYRKPVGIYWLQAAAVTIAGGSEAGRIWPHRIPSLLAALASLLLTAAIGDRLFGHPTGMVAALLLAASPLLGVEARLATTDAALLAACLLAIWALAGIHGRRDEPRGVHQPWRWRWGEPLLFWAAIGVGLLLKGPVVLLVAGGTVLGLVASERRWRWLGDLRPLPGICLALAIAGPWFLLIVRASGGAFFERSFGQDFLGKLVGVQESHFGPPGYYLLLFCATFWPGTLVATLAIPAVWRERRERAVRFCLAWLVPAWIVFELALTKLPHYVLPLYPAIAILAAQALVSGTVAPGITLRGRTAIAVWLAIGAAIAAAGILLPWSLDAAIEPLAIPLAALVVLLMAAVLVARRRRREALAFGLLLALGAAPAVALFGRVLPNLEPLWLTRAVAATVAGARPCPTGSLAVVGYHEPSLVFTLGTATALTDLSGAAAHLAADPDCGLALVPEALTPVFLARATAAGATARPVAAVAGFDYNDLHVERLTLFAGH